jgi:hypothetical protein
MLRTITNLARSNVNTSRSLSTSSFKLPDLTFDFAALEPVVS